MTIAGVPPNFLNHGLAKSGVDITVISTDITIPYNVRPPRYKLVSKPQ